MSLIVVRVNFEALFVIGDGRFFLSGVIGQHSCNVVVNSFLRVNLKHFSEGFWLTRRRHEFFYVTSRNCKTDLPSFWRLQTNPYHASRTISKNALRYTASSRADGNELP